MTSPPPYPIPGSEEYVREMEKLRKENERLKEANRIIRDLNAHRGLRIQALEQALGKCTQRRERMAAGD